MSKQIKQMQMAVLAERLNGVRDLVFLSASKIDSTTENKIRLGLRKKNVSLLLVKNSLLRRVFGETQVDPGEAVWVGPTLLAWGAESIKELSNAVHAALLKDDKLKGKVTVKATLAEGLVIPFDRALVMPTRKEAIGDVIAAALGPASSIVSALTNPAAELASQLQTIAEKTPAEAPAEAPASS